MNVRDHLKQVSHLEEWIRALLADDEGDAERAEEDAAHDHQHVHHEPSLPRGGAAIAAAQLLERCNLIIKSKFGYVAEGKTHLVVPPALEVPGHHHGDGEEGHPGQNHEDGVRAQQGVDVCP